MSLTANSLHEALTREDDDMSEQGTKGRPAAERPARFVLALDSGCCGKVQLSSFKGEMVSAEA